MDFTTTEAADDLGNLVDTIVDSVCTPEHQRELDGLDQRFDRDLWRKLIDAGILSSASASSLGGDGFGALEQIAILVALGRQLAAVPYLESVMLGAGALARFGSEELQQSWGVPAVNGEKTLSVALDGEMGDGPVQVAGARRPRSRPRTARRVCRPSAVGSSSSLTTAPGPGTPRCRPVRRGSPRPRPRRRAAAPPGRRRRAAWGWT